jgi:hypothetical protein
MSFIWLRWAAIVLAVHLVVAWPRWLPSLISALGLR